jgi:hypothetical protein
LNCDYLSIGLNGLTQRSAREYLREPDSTPPAQLPGGKFHHDAISEVCTLRFALDHLCLGHLLISGYYDDHRGAVAASAELDFNLDDQHIADLVPVAQIVRRALEAKARCECVLKSAVRLETALRGLWQPSKGAITGRRRRSTRPNLSTHLPKPTTPSWPSCCATWQSG